MTSKNNENFKNNPAFHHKIEADELLKLAEKESEYKKKLAEKRADQLFTYEKLLEKQKIEFSEKLREKMLRILKDEESKEQQKQVDELYKKIKQYDDTHARERLEKLLKNIDITDKKRELLEKRYQNLVDKHRAETIENLGKQLEKALENPLKSILESGKLVNALTGSLDSTINSYANLQRSINTRLQGSGEHPLGFFGLESHLLNAVGIQPYVKSEQLMENLSKMVDLGISYNVEQRTFIQTIAEEVANTFDATNEALLRLVRIQQSDSTAARLGLEANLTKLFNNMFENTEYLKKSFDGVSASLLEASSQLSTSGAISFEYQVQKWLGSLSSVGMSDNAISNIASAIGFLGSGDIESLTGNQALSNLMVMSANRSSLNIGELLKDGLDASETNKLMVSMVSYLQEIAKSSDSNVVKSQYAKMFGISLSDLSAVSNLSISEMNKLATKELTHSSAIGELMEQMSILPVRLGLPTLMDNLWSNLQYNLGTNVAKNPATYALWKTTNLIQDTTKGINIPFINAMGFGVDLNTTVENLMKLGVVGMGTLGMIGDFISGMSSSVVPLSMLGKLGITRKVDYLQRGSGFASTTSGEDYSAETLIGNTAGGELGDYTLQKEQDKQQEELNKRQEEIRDYNKLSYEYVSTSLDSKLTAIISILGSGTSGGIRSHVSSYVSSVTQDLSSFESPMDSLLVGLSKNMATVNSNNANDITNSQDNLLDSIGVNLSKIVELLGGTLSVKVDKEEIVNAIREAKLF